MKKTVQYFDDVTRGQYATVEDAPMIALLDKLRKLAGTPHVKIYWRKHHNYKEDCDMYWIYGEFIELQHQISLANECGAGGRRLWLTHRFQRSNDEAISPIYIMSEAQIDAFDHTWDMWMLVGQDLTDSDLSVAEDILQL